MNKDFEINYVLRRMSSFGAYPFHILLIIIFLLLEYYTYSLNLLLGFVLIYVFGFPLRLLFFRERPKKREYNKSLYSKFIASSFPSLHTTRATYLTLFLIFLFDNLKLTLLLILLLFIVAYSRVYRKKHYFTDTFWGFVLGVVIWYLIYILTMFINY